MLNLALYFLIACLAALALSRLISRWLLELLGQRWYVLLLWPGVVIHELSHLIGALITLTPIRGVSLWPKVSGGKMELGSVTHDATANPLKLIIISFFPVLGGVVVLWLATRWLTPIQVAGVPLFSLIDGSLDSLVIYFTRWWQFISAALGSLNLASWSGWLFIYLVVVAGAHLAPSNHDLVYTTVGVVILGLTVLLLALVLWLVGQTWLVNLLALVVNVLQFLVPFLSYVLVWLLLVAIVSGILALCRRLNQKVVW